MGEALDPSLGAGLEDQHQTPAAHRDGFLGELAPVLVDVAREPIVQAVPGRADAPAQLRQPRARALLDVAAPVEGAVDPGDQLVHLRQPGCGAGELGTRGILRLLHPPRGGPGGLQEIRHPHQVLSGQRPARVGEAGEELPDGEVEGADQRGARGEAGALLVSPAADGELFLRGGRGQAEESLPAEVGGGELGEQREQAVELEGAPGGGGADRRFAGGPGSHGGVLTRRGGRGGI